jgi:RNA polymerase sigma-70 factor (ECF subfamily)
MPVACNKVRGIKKAQTTAAPKTYSQSEITNLIEKAVGGNFSAFGELYSVYLDQIYRYVFYQVKDKMTAEDITEEVFIKAWKAISSCKGKEKTFLPWLYRIAHNHLINTLRVMKKCTPIEKIEISDPKQEIFVDSEYRELLETINCLPGNQKQVIILKFIEGLDNRAIAKIIKKSEGAVRISQMRALATLRQKLGKGGRENEE